MDPVQIRFDDGAAYEDFMGVWSRLAGEDFLRWLAPASGRRWADVGCGNGAFTELLFDRCAPAHVHGVDPSEEQLAFARARLAERPARFAAGSATALPWPDASVDAAVMALVIFFVPDPALAVREMARVVAPGGSVSSYSWDLLGGGFPCDILQKEMTRLGTPPVWPPSAEASRMDVLGTLWRQAGLVDLRTHVVTVQRTYESFDAFWRIARTGPRLATRFASMAEPELRRLQDGVRERLAPDAHGRITSTASANAIEGRVPG